MTNLCGLKITFSIIYSCGDQGYLVSLHNSEINKFQLHTKLSTVDSDMGA